MSTRKIRIGIDVGGTFTHAVAINAKDRTLLGKTKVPTTHQMGVGKGIIDSLKQLLVKNKIQTSEIVLVAHSTTQATNSLLEGDVERVAIVSTGTGRAGARAKKAAALGKIKLSEGKYLETRHHHVSLAKSKLDPQTLLDTFLTELKRDGFKVVVVTAPFSNESPEQEIALAEYIRAQGFTVSATHEVCELYGLRVRTRTTAINASILPKMLEVAESTEKQLRAMGIAAPLMIMRSDGGIMTIEEMRKRPILTLLSGPAAGIAAALKYLEISDGIFLEVGGTSTDISVIKNGRALTRSAVIGGQKTFLRTLDCRTIGIGGGSLARFGVDRNRLSVLEVGPRSAHIAGLHYFSFTASKPLRPKSERWSPKFIQPKKGDPSDYLVLESQDTHSDSTVAVTPTCAANVLKLVPAGDSAFAAAFKHKAVGSVLTQELSQEILDEAASKLIPTILKMLKQYQMDSDFTVMVGGGGGASALVPFVAQKLGMRFEIAKDNEVISAIGVAMGMVREVIERSVVNPGPNDLYQIRQDARAKVLAQGASPESIEVRLEVDTRKNVVRAEAQGTISYQSQTAQGECAESKDPELNAQFALGLKVKPSLIAKARAARLTATSFEVKASPKSGLAKWLGRHGNQSYTVVTDERGIVRLRIKDATMIESNSEQMVSRLKLALEQMAAFNDGGIEYPLATVLIGDRIVDLSKLQSLEQIQGVLELEARETPPHEKAVLILSKHASSNELGEAS